MITGIIMIVVGIVFLSLYMMAYMNLSDEKVYEDELYSKDHDEKVNDFVKYNKPTVLFWKAIILLGILIIIYNLFYHGQ